MRSQVQCDRWLLLGRPER